MSYLTDQQSKDLKRLGKWFVIGVIAIAVIALVIHLFINRTTPMPVEMKAQVDSLKAANRRSDTAITMLHQEIHDLDSRLAGLNQRGQVIKQDIEKNESRKVDLKQTYDKMDATTHQYNHNDIDEYISRNYGH
jgi:signal transduction histidine kinase